MFAYINNSPFYCVEAGNPASMPVVFLHGFPFSHAMWLDQLALVGKEFRAIAYDLRGHGLSCVGDGQFSIEGHVDDLMSLLDHFKIEKAAIVGLSMGGYTTLRALERNPERFCAAVLCNTKSDADTNEGKLKRFANVKFVKQEGTRAFAGIFTQQVFAPESFSAKPEAVAMAAKTIERTPVLSIAGTLMALASRTDTTESLAKITIPTLIIVGEKDITTPPSASEAMHKFIAGSEMHVIPRAAHMSNLENPEVFNEKLIGFLRKVAKELL